MTLGLVIDRTIGQTYVGFFCFVFFSEYWYWMPFSECVRMLVLSPTHFGQHLNQCCYIQTIVLCTKRMCSLDEWNGFL